VHQNLIFGIGFIVVMLILAAMRWVNPILAAVLHFGGASVVIFNSARLVRFGEELHAPRSDEAERPKPRVAPEPVPTS